MRNAILVLSYVLLIFLGTVGTIAVYSDDAYSVSQAENWVWRARATNDLDDMANYTQKALNILEPYNGNPKWYFATPDTNYDYIKDNLREVIRNCESINATADDMAYQQAVSNMQETLVEIADHVNSTVYWEYATPWFAIWLVLVSFWWIPVLFLWGN